LLRPRHVHKGAQVSRLKRTQKERGAHGSSSHSSSESLPLSLPSSPRAAAPPFSTSTSTLPPRGPREAARQLGAGRASKSWMALRLRPVRRRPGASSPSAALWAGCFRGLPRFCAGKGNKDVSLHSLALTEKRNQTARKPALMTSIES